jgi:hypothetical protein
MKKILVLVLGFSFSAGVMADTNVSGSVSGTWAVSGSPYIATGELTLNDGQALTIDAGVQVKFNGSYAFRVYGKLVAQGISENHIVFTSNKATPAPGDWGGLFFVASDEGTVMEYCDVMYGGDGGWRGSPEYGYVYCDGNVTGFQVGSNLSISHCVLKNSKTSGIYLQTNASPSISDCDISKNGRYGVHCGNSSGSNPTIIGCTISDNVNTGIISDHALFLPAIEGCTISNNGGYAISVYPNAVPKITGVVNMVGNTNNSINVTQGGGIDSGTWHDHGVPYVVKGSDIQVNDSQALTLDPGVDLRFEGCAFRVYGKLVARGTDGNRIVFTSNKATPVPGDWGGLFFVASDEGTVMEYCDVMYGGDGGWRGSPEYGYVYCDGNVNDFNTGKNLNINYCSLKYSKNDGIYYVTNSSPLISSISDCIISNNNRSGIYVGQDAYPEINWCKILENLNGIISQGGTPKINFCDIYNNIQYDVKNLSPQNIDAKLNYWGPLTTMEMNTGANPKNISKIYDHFDNTANETVDYSTWQTGEHAILFVSPNNTMNECLVNVTVRGRGFQPGAVVKLTKSGYQDILGSQTALVDSSKIITLFNLTGVQHGDWNVVVVNPGGRYLTKENGFKIGIGFENVWIDIVGRDNILLGRSRSYKIRYGNTGNIDARKKQLIVKFPKELEYKINTSHPSNPEIDWNSIQKSYSDSIDTLIPICLQELKPQKDYELEIEIKLPLSASQQTSINMSAGILNDETAEKITNSPTIDPELQQILDEYQIPRENFLNKFKELVNKFWNENSLISIPIAMVLIGILALVLIEFGLTTAIALSIASALVNGGMMLSALINASNELDRAAEVLRNRNIRVQRSIDPNEKSGPKGFNDDNFIFINQKMPYTIYFENLAAATAAAEEVMVLDTLDANLDGSALALGDFQFGDTTITVSGSAQNFDKTVVLNDTTHVQITGDFAPATGILQWHFKGTDPRTGEFAGFLPPNKVPPEGEGWVGFTIKPKTELPSGTQVANRASIVFDVNPAMLTNTVLNTLDAAAPASRVDSVSAGDTPLQFKIHWAGADETSGSGIKGYTVYSSSDGGPYAPWVASTTDTLKLFTGIAGHDYAYYSAAQDNVGNPELQPDAPDFSMKIAGYNYAKQGWYLISLPVNPLLDSAAVLFPSSYGTFEWNFTEQMYNQTAQLQPRKAYWLAVPNAMAGAASGIPLTQYTRHYAMGWHMIGSVCGEVDFSNPNDDPDGAVLMAFGWDPEGEAYFPTTKLESQMGYWIAIIQECDLTLGHNAGLPKLTGVKDRNEKIKAFFEKFGSVPPKPPLFPNQSQDGGAIPLNDALFQSYPNPFNAETVIRYGLAKPGLTRIHIYNILGEKVATVVDQAQSAGYYRIVWDGKMNNGLRAASGLYLYRIESEGFKAVRKMLLLR